MACTKWSSVRGLVMRVTRVDSCGLFVPGPGGSLVTEGFVEANYSLELDEGTEIIVKKANSTFCINEPGCPLVKWVNLELQFCQVNPDLINLMTGWPLVTDCNGGGVGFRIQEEVQCTTGSAIEIWSDIPDQACAEDQLAYGYFLAPWVTQAIMGDISIKDDAATFTITAKTRKGSQWGVGPYLVDLEEGSFDDDICDTPSGLLTPIGSTDHLDIHLTRVAPPEETKGCAVTLVDAA